MNKLSLGAIDTETNEYVLPDKAQKIKNYKCADCDNKVILKKGEIRRVHFAHKVQTEKCTYYEHPNETQIHKDAKLLMAKLLKDKALLWFYWEECSNINKYGKKCTAYSPFYDQLDPSVFYKDGDEVVIEYRDKNNRYVADVALINNGEPRYIFEIKNTHATKTHRPEPWFEIDAEYLIRKINELMSRTGEDEYTKDTLIEIKCIRNNIIRRCYGSFCQDEKWVENIKYHKHNLVNNCVLCNKEEYDGPSYPSHIRVCWDCLDNDIYEQKIRKKFAHL